MSLNNVNPAKFGQIVLDFCEKHEVKLSANLLHDLVAMGSEAKTLKGYEDEVTNAIKKVMGGREDFMFACPSCGSHVLVEYEKCPTCDAALTDEGVQEAERERRGKEIEEKLNEPVKKENFSLPSREDLSKMSKKQLGAVVTEVKKEGIEIKVNMKAKKEVIAESVADALYGVEEKKEEVEEKKPAAKKKAAKEEVADEDLEEEEDIDLDEDDDDDSDLDDEDSGDADDDEDLDDDDDSDLDDDDEDDSDLDDDDEDDDSDLDDDDDEDEDDDDDSDLDEDDDDEDDDSDVELDDDDEMEDDDDDSDLDDDDDSELDDVDLDDDEEEEEKPKKTSKKKAEKKAKKKEVKKEPKNKAKKATGKKSKKDTKKSPEDIAAKKKAREEKLAKMRLLIPKLRKDPKKVDKLEYTEIVMLLPLLDVHNPLKLGGKAKMYAKAKEVLKKG